MIERIQHDDGIKLLLTPNRSLSWRGNVILWSLFSLLVMGIAIAMALAGAWVVLPFAGAELLGLMAGLYYTSRQCHRKEVLTLTGETLRLEKGMYEKEREWEMPRRYVRLHIRTPSRPWKNPTMHLVHRDLDLRLAGFLNQDDTKALLEFLETRGILIEHEKPNEVVWF